MECTCLLFAFFCNVWNPGQVDTHHHQQNVQKNRILSEGKMVGNGKRELDQYDTIEQFKIRHKEMEQEEKRTITRE